MTTLINSGPYDQVYTNFVDANGVFYIIFGDGANGYVPTLGSEILCTYQTNVGALGNVGSNTIVQSSSAIIGLVSALNPLPASGGTSAESLSSIAVNAPASLKTLNRAVTVGDIENMAIQSPGVQWASAIQSTYQLVNLYIAPFGGGDPSSLLIEQVLGYIDPLIMANTTVTIFNPSYIPINVTIDLVVYPNYGNTAVTLEVQAAIYNMLALSNTGFGFRISLGLVYQTILTQPGVNYAIVTALNRQILTGACQPADAQQQLHQFGGHAAATGGERGGCVDSHECHDCYADHAERDGGFWWSGSWCVLYSGGVVYSECCVPTRHPGAGYDICWRLRNASR